MASIECPVCGAATTKKPFPPHISVIPWGDCACSDCNLCPHHRYSDEGMPERPSSDVLHERAQQRHAEEIAEYEAKVALFEQIEADLRFNELQRTMGNPVEPSRRLRRQADVDAAFLRGVEVMRQLAAKEVVSYDIKVVDPLGRVFPVSGETLQTLADAIQRIPVPQGG